MIWAHRSLMSTPLGDPLTEGGDSLQLLLSSPSDSIPSPYADLFISANCHALRENKYPILPPSPISSWQSFHELVVRPNQSVKPPSTTMSVKHNREHANLPEHETRCSSLLGSSDSDIMGLVIFVTRAQILLHPQLYPGWIPDRMSVPLDFFFTHTPLAPPSFRITCLPTLPSFPPDLLSLCPPFGAMSDRLSAACLQALRLQYKAQFSTIPL